MRNFELPGRSPVYAANGICATSHPLAASAAIETLKAGGNAVDAAIAGAVLLGFCEPQMTGLGGDMFALIKPAGSEDVVALNASGRAPQGMDAAALRAEGLSEIPDGSAHAVTLPGAVDGFCRLSERYGSQELAQVLAPAIHYAEAGVPVAPRVALDWKAAEGRLQGRAKDLFRNGGAALPAGAMFRAPKQAEALRRVAKEGRDGFYTGPVAADMVAALQEAGGSHTEADFAAVEASWGDPIQGTYRSHEIVEHPPNGQGVTALLIAQILAEFDLAKLDPFGAERAHLEAEATKRAYALRDLHLADLGHMAEPLAMADPALAAQIAAQIDPKRAGPFAPPLEGAPHKDTIYITVVDKDRMAVSLIYSVFHSFGSGIASEQYGILLHNRGAGFCLTEGHPNEAAPDKRPLHTIIPGMLRKGGRIVMPFGVMGGQYQACGHARFVTNTVDFGMDPQAAIDGARCFPWDGELQLESSYAPEVAEQLTAMGHKIAPPPTAIGGAQAIDMSGDVLIGGSDPRKDGCALGY